MNTKGTGALIMMLEKSEMMDKVMLEQQRDSDWPNGIFTNMWEQVPVDEFPDNDVAETEMDDGLRKLKPPRNKDPKYLLVDMAAIEVQCKCNMTKRKKAAVVL